MLVVVGVPRHEKRKISAANYDNGNAIKEQDSYSCTPINSVGHGHPKKHLLVLYASKNDNFLQAEAFEE